MPGAGIEPAWPCGRRILSPMRLPISPSGHGDSLPHSHRVGKRRPSGRRKQRSPACGASTCFRGSGHGAGNETFTRTVSRCFPITFFAKVVSEDLNCSLVFCPRQQVRLKKSTDGHRPPLRTPESHTVRLRPPRTRTHHRPPRSRLVHPSIVRPRTILCRYIRMPGKHDRLGHRYVPLDVVQRLPSPRAL